ncbi:hypothetical protein GCM10009784_27190 [Arthrobacter parietis]|uniref:VWFA domain-containing protein n=1 Tax=Arthrobacter parietis TaxID=271434 RepID=A0ABP5MQW2_9MICC
MRSLRSPLLIATTLALVTGCAAGEPAEPGTSAPPKPTTTAAASSSPAVAGTAGLTAVPFDDAPRALTELEESLLVEPGPNAEAGTVEDVLAAARESDPQTADEWSSAILALIHGDYTENVKTVVRFDPGTGERGDEPTANGTAPAEEQSVGQNHFALVLDASNSMAESSGEGSRMEAAKASLLAFTEELPGGSTVSLRVYGHAGDASEAGKAESCATTEVLYSGASNDAGLEETLASVQPTGYTPLAQGISDAASDFPGNATDGIVYVVTDGVETCGGDPVEAAKELSVSGIEPVVNVIGFQAGDTDQAALAAIAAAGGGKYTQANSQADLDAYWKEQNRAMLRAWNEWRSTELAAIGEASSDIKRTVNEVSTELKRTANDEAERGKRVANLLRGEIDDDVRSEIWDFFDQRRTTVWNWAEETRAENWEAAESERAQNWEAVYNRAQSKWTEYYERLQGN